MPDVNNVYQSEFMRATQLQGQPRRAQIESATVEVLGQGDKAQQKIVLRLVRCKQRLPLNKTNAQALAAAMGPLTDNWIGQTIELRPDKVSFAGSLVDTIRTVHIPAAAAGGNGSPPSPPSAGNAPFNDLEDDIP